jgi:hypothetical protein
VWREFYRSDDFARSESALAAGNMIGLHNAYQAKTLRNKAVFAAVARRPLYGGLRATP